MKIDVTYSYYTDEYKGRAIAADDFPRYAGEAEMLVNTCTYGRIHHYQLREDDLQAVKQAVCAVAEIIYGDSQNKLRTGGKSVKSENTDGYSVTYVDLPAGMTEEQALHQKCYTKIRLYLQDTTLLYPGVYYDYEC